MAAVGPLAGRLLEIAAVMAFLLLILVAPLPMGGNRDWAWAPMTVAVGVIAVLAAASPASRNGAPVLAPERALLVLLLASFAFFTAISLLQMSSLAPETLSASIYARARELLGQAHAAVPTLAVDASRNVLLKSFACGLIFLTARTLFQDPERARLLLMALVVSALLVAIYGLMSQVTTNSCLVGGFLKKQGEYTVGYRCLMSGTFVNSNSFACFVGMGLVAVLALLFSNRTPPHRRHRRHEEEEEFEDDSFINLVTGPRVTLVAVGLLFLGVMLISGSRAGFGASVLGGLILVALMMRGRWQSRSQVGRAMLIGGVIAVVVGLIAGGALLQKLATFSEGGSVNRIYIWRTALEAAARSPWLGWGRGEFADIYTILQPAEIIQANDLAHSTPLETLVELGLPGALAAFLLVLVPWGVCLRGALLRHRGRYLPAAAFAIAAVPILHSTVDFSLQMPAIAFATSAFLGLGWAQAFARRSQPDLAEHDEDEEQ